MNRSGRKRRAMPVRGLEGWIEQCVRRARRAGAVGALIGACVFFVASTGSAAAAELETPETTAPTSITSTGAQLNGVLSPNAAGEPGAYFFRYGPATEECRETPFDSPLTPDEGHQAEHVSAVVEGLLPATTYTFCLVAQNTEETERKFATEVTFTTLTAAPAISGEAITSTGVTTAALSATIASGGLATSYRAEYVTEEQFEAHGWAEASRVPLADAELPASGVATAVREELSNLDEHTAYRARFVATNTKGTIEGAGTEFITSPASGLGASLPDGRGFELVSVGGSGEPYLPPTPIVISQAASESRSRLPFRAGASGEAVTYVAEPTASGGTGETGPGLGNQWLASRASGSWQTANITPANNLESVYQAFDDNLTASFYEGGPNPLTPGVEAGCVSLYTRSTADGRFGPLFTSGQAPKECGHPLFAGASEDRSQIIFQSEAALTPNAQPATKVPPGHEGRHGKGESEGQPCMFGCNLYAWAGAQLKLVNVINGVTVPDANFGGYAGEHALTDLSNAISRDGSRIFWTDTAPEPEENYGHVYVLENATTNVQVSGSEPAQYWTATPDGRYAYYTENGALWRFDTTTNTRVQLADEAAEVKGVIGTNQTGPDGAYLYFVANGALATGATAERPNLYVIHDEITSFIKTLSAQDAEIEAFSEGLFIRSSVWGANLGERLAEVTPDGQHLVFQSEQPPAGYDNTFEGSPAPEVFVYEAGSGKLACASCDPTGRPPASNEHQHSKLPESAEADTFMRRWVSDNGSRVFFDSEQPLSAQDTNGVQDVYEWEREGEGSCRPVSPPRKNAGCVYLLSGGASQSDSFLIDADAQGNNVFFEHVGSLGSVPAPAGHNELYDARVGGGGSPPTVGCGGAGCESSAPAPAAVSAAASTAFSGSGNFPPPAPTPVHLKPPTRAQLLAKALKVCHKDKNKHKRSACEARAKKKYGAKAKAKQSAHSHRRAR